MTIQDDETLQMYLEESIEHLADIETDLLAIEEAGADIDEDLVNKVYRAAHSIKGGAGFMGLTTIKDLTHEMENILAKSEAERWFQHPEIVNVLLMASDTLKALMNDVFTSNEVDISKHIDASRPLPKANRCHRHPPRRSRIRHLPRRLRRMWRPTALRMGNRKARSK
jgi:two-component system chemotaxis sensor kinase CheA